MTADSLHLLHVGWIIDFLAKNRLPGMYLVHRFFETDHIGRIQFC
jgi:hypothetical protein